MVKPCELCVRHDDCDVEGFIQRTKLDCCLWRPALFPVPAAPEASPAKRERCPESDFPGEPWDGDSAPASPFAPFVPPFKYDGHEYIADSKGNKVLDIRGWGYLTAVCKLTEEQAIEVQDHIGHAVAAAMNNPELTNDGKKI